VIAAFVLDLKALLQDQLANPSPSLRLEKFRVNWSRMSTFISTSHSLSKLMCLR
jgi:hypothetical protein